MKKVVRYLQKQAVQYSDEKYSSAAYLSPRRNHEPQVRISDRSHHHDDLKPGMIGSRSMPPNERRTSSRRAAVPSRISSNIQRFQYAAENILQSYEIFIPPAPPASTGSTPHGSGASTPLTPGSSIHTPEQKYWIVFIHGGYFRDPSVLASSFHATLDILTDPQSPDASIREMQHHVKGYVSINYRLAQHEAHPQDPDTTPAYEMRNAKWPAMLDDVLAALRHWQAKHPEVGERYLLVGHSVGATLALNALLNAQDHDHDHNHVAVTPPLGVVGVNGIYDFIALHKSHPEYRGMTANAVGQEQWDRVSPARQSRRRFESAWGASRSSLNKNSNNNNNNSNKKSKRRTKRWLILAHSREDKLLDWDQVERMNAVFDVDNDEVAAGAEHRQKEDEADGVVMTVMSEIVEIKGGHNACWEDGKELARVIREGVGEMMGVDQ